MPRIITVTISITTPEGPGAPIVEINAGAPSPRPPHPTPAPDNGPALDALRRFGVRGPASLIRDYGADRVLDVLAYVKRRGQAIDRPAAYLVKFLRSGFALPESFRRDTDKEP